MSYLSVLRKVFPFFFLRNFLRIFHPALLDDLMDGTRATYMCGPTIPYDSSVRTDFFDVGARIYAWPSRGGVIVLDDAESIDFEFLGLDPLNPPPSRLEDQAAEEAFCQRLLLLGAKWWDSEARYSIVSAFETGAFVDRRVDDAFYLDNQAPPTMSEKRLIKVGWPSTGGLWVSEFDTAWAGLDEEDNEVPHDEELGRLKMARTMDERCRLLRDRFRAKYFDKVEDYVGYGFLNSWDSKDTGEIGPLLQPAETFDLWRSTYYMTHDPQSSSEERPLSVKAQSLSSL